MRTLYDLQIQTCRGEVKRSARVVTRLVRYVGTGAVGFLAGGVGIYLYMVQGGPPLQPWHTAELNEEFTADDAGAVRTFAAYRELEDRLMTQLDEQVSAQVDTGPAFTLARYSSGSAADPNTRTPNWNRSFDLPASPTRGGVLLLHGLTDSPYSLRTIAQSLNQRGYWVTGLRLPGHGTAPAGLTSVNTEDLEAAVRLAVDHLGSQTRGAPLHVVGYSTGAALALEHVLDLREGYDGPDVASLVLISPAIGVSQVAALARWQDRLAMLPGLGRLAWTDIVPEFDPFKYNSFPTNAAAQVFELTRSVATRVETGSAAGPLRDFPPTLVFMSTVDATVSAAAVIDNLLEHLAPEGHELVLFDINRSEVVSTVLIADPAPLTERLTENPALPFALTLVTNASPDSLDVVSRRKGSSSNALTVRPLDLAWPEGVISLSHVALPFPPDDPLYGQRLPGREGGLQLGQISVQGELGLLQLPPTWLLRLRHNPFYEFLETRAIDWIDLATIERGPQG